MAVFAVAMPHHVRTQLDCFIADQACRPLVANDRAVPCPADGHVVWVRRAA